jgi:hypothetical protein
MQSVKRPVCRFKCVLGWLLSISAGMAHGAVLVSGNNAATSIAGPIKTYDFASSALVGSFVPDGASIPDANGRGIAIRGSKIYYTELSDVFGPTDSIRVAPYGTQGSGGHDVSTLPNPRPTTGIQDLAFFGGALYALTGYRTAPLQVFKLDPDTGAVLAGPISIASPAKDDSDGFAVLPNGNFLINEGDGSLFYDEYNGVTGNKVLGGLQINLGNFGFIKSTGVDLAPNEGSLYFVTDIGTVLQSIVQTDLAGNLIDSHPIGSRFIEDIAVVDTTPTLSFSPDSVDLGNGQEAVITIRRTGLTDSPLTVWLYQVLHTAHADYGSDFALYGVAIDEMDNDNQIVAAAHVVIPAGEDHTWFGIVGTVSNPYQDIRHATFAVTGDASYQINPNHGQATIGLTYGGE